MSEDKAKTVNGTPIRASSLNVEAPPVLKNSESGPLVAIARFYKRLNEILSGMYTGVGCAGTPHSHHSYTAENTQSDRKES